METYVEEKSAVATSTLGASQVWVHHIISLLDAAMRQLYPQEGAAGGAILEAAALLRQRIELPAAPQASNAEGRLLPWQVRKVRDYIDGHITDPLLVADLSALIQRSEAHFSRSFKRTFGESPHAFVVRRRVELAAQYMLTTDASLSDIALKCGFTDQPHLCKHFRQITRVTPAAWRRAHRAEMTMTEIARNTSPRPAGARSIAVRARACSTGRPSRSGQVSSGEVL